MTVNLLGEEQETKLEYIITFILQVTLMPGSYTVFRVRLLPKELEGIHDGAIQITTDYEVLLNYKLYYINYIDPESIMYENRN